MKKGDKFKYQLPSWVCGGEKVIVNVCKILKNDFNFHDFKGEYYDSKGIKHIGLFYLKDCEPC